jgi:hypothetical protein
MSSKILIIGKNSKIVKSIESKLSQNYTLISHNELKKIDIDSYKLIYLFSWSHTKFKENLAIVNSLPRQKVIFISSLSVLTLNMRSQWAKYPNEKAAIEKKILDKNGYILRIGFFISSSGNRFSSGGSYPITTPEQLVNWMEKFDVTVTKKESNIFSIKTFKKSFFDRKLFDVLHLLSIKSESTLTRKFLWLIPRLFSKEKRGYSGDLLSCFSENIQIGYGVLGSRYAKKYHNSRGSQTYIVSTMPDEMLNSNGFRLSRVGKFKTGLSKYWHGVSIIKKNQNYYKKVPLIVRRPKLPIFYTRGDVISINYSDNIFEITYKNVKNKILKKYSNKLCLAAGPLENIRLISNYVKENTSLSDQEIGRFGYINYQDFISSFNPVTLGPFIYCKKVIRSKIDYGQNNKIDYLIEARPNIGKKYKDQNEFYMAQSKTIFYKLITQFSFKRINEAFYNKFGVCVKTNSFQVYVQILSENCINYDFNKGFSRDRIQKKIIQLVINDLKKYFKSYAVNNNEIELIDALHIQGGENLLQNNNVQKLLLNHKLTIVGSPTSIKLNSFHNTENLSKSL